MNTISALVIAMGFCLVMLTMANVKERGLLEDGNKPSNKNCTGLTVIWQPTDWHCAEEDVREPRTCTVLKRNPPTEK